MSGTAPNFTDWKRLAAFSIGEVACLLAEIDPRAMSEVADENGDGIDLSDEVKILVSAVYAEKLKPALHQVAPFTRDTLVRADSLIQWLNSNGYPTIGAALSQAELPQTAIDTPFEQADGKPCLPTIVPESNMPMANGIDSKYPWAALARKIAEEMLREDPTLHRFNLLQIAKKVHCEMTKRMEAGQPGLTGRSKQVPKPETIKRHALTGLK